MPPIIFRFTSNHCVDCDVHCVSVMTQLRTRRTALRPVDPGCHNRLMDWPLFDGLSDEEQQAVVRRATRRRFGRREVIFHEGDAGDAVHLVEHGHVALRVTTSLGDSALIRVVSPGHFFGELVLLVDAPRSATAIAIEGAVTRSLHRSQFDDLRRSHPAVQDAIGVALAREVRRTTGELIEALFIPAKLRLWRRLQALGAVYASEHETVIPLTQEEIGQLAGLTRPTTNRLLREAEAEGALALSRGHVTVIDLAWIDRRAR